MTTLAIAQMNATVGDIDGNVARIRAVYGEAAAKGADLVVCPEMVITGYPLDDLVLRPSVQWEAVAAVETLARATAGGNAALLVGGLWLENDQLYNATFLLENGACMHRQYKHALPNYGVFDEKRVFASGPLPEVITWRGTRLGILICEDAWHEETVRHLAAGKPDWTVIQNGSPFEMGKESRRVQIVRRVTELTRAPVMYVNLVGGQDDLVFDGQSFIMNGAGEIMGQCAAFQNELAVTGWEGSVLRLSPWERQEIRAGLPAGFPVRALSSSVSLPHPSIEEIDSPHPGPLPGGEGVVLHCIAAPLRAALSPQETLYQAMMLGLRDYVEKNRFKGVLLGLSGGIDSGLTAAVAVDALGAERVRAVLMPSPHTSRDSFEDAAECAAALGIRMDTIPITPGMEVVNAMLAPVFAGLPDDTTEENIQARLRGNVLMAMSNKLGLMVLTTGNKSEMAVGYATLYGDMCGGYSVLKDVYKTTVYELSRWRNAHTPAWALGPKAAVIPERMITKAPTAELKPNQTDQDSLPPYDILDAILYALVEERLGVDAIVARGFDRDMVVNILRMLTRSEYKRRQAPPGVKLSPMSFGKDWRYPITNRFRN